MFSVGSLEYTIRELYRDACEGYDTETVGEMLDSLCFEDLLQAVRHNARTVHAYTAQGDQRFSFNYRGGDLFGQRAAKLYEEFDQSSAEAVVAARAYELWLLEDMSLVVAACVSVSYENGAYETEYREIKAGGPCDAGMCLDPEDLTAALNALCEPVYEHQQPVYEL